MSFGLHLQAVETARARYVCTSSSLVLDILKRKWRKFTIWAASATVRVFPDPGMAKIRASTGASTAFVLGFKKFRRALIALSSCTFGKAARKGFVESSFARHSRNCVSPFCFLSLSQSSFVGDVPGVFGRCEGRGTHTIFCWRIRAFGESSMKLNVGGRPLAYSETLGVTCGF
jgi:hypothetical protein